MWILYSYIYIIYIYRERERDTRNFGRASRGLVSSSQFPLFSHPRISSCGSTSLSGSCLGASSRSTFYQGGFCCGKCCVHDLFIWNLSTRRPTVLCYNSCFGSRLRGYDLLMLLLMGHGLWSFMFCPGVQPQGSQFANIAFWVQVDGARFVKVDVQESLRGHGVLRCLFWGKLRGHDFRGCFGGASTGATIC